MTTNIETRVDALSFIDDDGVIVTAFRDFEPSTEPDTEPTVVWLFNPTVVFGRNGLQPPEDLPQHIKASEAERDQLAARLIDAVKSARATLRAAQEQATAGFAELFDPKPDPVEAQAVEPAPVDPFSQG